MNIALEREKITITMTTKIQHAYRHLAGTHKAGSYLV